MYLDIKRTCCMIYSDILLKKLKNKQFWPFFQKLHFLSAGKTTQFPPLYIPIQFAPTSENHKK